MEESNKKNQNLEKKDDELLVLVQLKTIEKELEIIDNKINIYNKDIEKITENIKLIQEENYSITENIKKLEESSNFRKQELMNLSKEFNTCEENYQEVLYIFLIKIYNNMI